MPNLKETYESCKIIDSISNKRNIDSEILKAYINLYNFLHEKIAEESVIPKLKDNEIIETWISNRNWLMIPPKDCSNRDEAKKSPYPNIWIDITEDLKFMDCGLHWAQVNSVDNFLNILDPLNYRSRKKLKDAFRLLKKDYTIITQKKIHDKGLAPAAPSAFEEVKSWKLNEFNSDVADEILNSIDTIRREGRQLREYGKVEWCVPTVQIEYKQFEADDYEQLLEIIMDYIKILKVCHETLTNSQIRIIKRNLKKHFDYNRLKKEYGQLRFLLKINYITEEHFKKKIQELNKMIKDYNSAFNQNLDFFNV